MLSIRFKDIDVGRISYPPKQEIDFRVILATNTKCHLLNKMRLHKSSFLHRYITNDKTRDCNVLYITKQLNGELFEMVLGSFYGQEIIVEDGKQLYELYTILQFLQIEELIDQIHEFLLQDLKNIVVGYQISELYEVDALSGYYLKYFKQFGFNQIFNEKIDLVLLQQQIILQGKNIVPTNYLLLQELPFKKLIYLHNKMYNKEDQKFLTQIQIAQKIKEYCLVHKFDSIKLREIMQDLLIRNQISQSQQIKLFTEFQQETQCFRTATNSVILTMSEQMNDSFREDLNEIITESESTRLHTQEMLNDMEINKIQIKLNDSLKPFLVYEGLYIDNSIFIGLSNLLFQFETQYTKFGFYVSKKIELGKFIEDQELQLINISQNKTQQTSLRVNKIRFDEESINVNNRLIIKQNIGISRYDDELDVNWSSFIPNYECAGFEYYKQSVLMKQLIFILLIISLGTCTHHLRHNSQNNSKSSKSLAQTQQVQYIDDDAVYVDPDQQQDNSNEETNVQEQEQSEQLQEAPEENQEQVNVQEEIQNVSQDTEDQLDKEEQAKYEEEQQQLLKIEQVSDSDTYLQNLDVQIQTQDPEEEMPVDVVETELNPQLPKEYQIDNSLGDNVDSDFMNQNDEPEYAIEAPQMMEGEIPQEEAEEKLRQMQIKEEMEAEQLAKEGPHAE